MPYQTSRQPNYFSDIEYGKIAENDFESIFIPSCRAEGYTVHDVRLVKEYQHADTDYVVDKAGGLSAPTLDEAVSNRSRYALIEVKLDWTITALKSRLKLFSVANSEGVRYLENLLGKLRKQQDL